MSEHFFGVRRGRLTAEQVELRETLAAKHDAAFVYADIPGTGLQSWFACENHGEPFNGRTARAVLDELYALEPTARGAR